MAIAPLKLQLSPQEKKALSYQGVLMVSAEPTRGLLRDPWKGRVHNPRKGRRMLQNALTPVKARQQGRHEELVAKDQPPITRGCWCFVLF